jgi:uncharacterized protein (TIGR03435 family)
VARLHPTARAVAAKSTVTPGKIALQEQLGLKLEYNKNPINVIVIDHIEKPSAN